MLSELRACKNKVLALRRHCASLPGWWVLMAVHLVLVVLQRYLCS